MTRLPKLLSYLTNVARAQDNARFRKFRPMAERLESREVLATFTWVPTNPGAYNWNDSANWTGGPTGTYPNAVGDVANLNTAITGNQLVNLNGPVTVGRLNLGSTGTAGAFTIAGNGATGALTFDVAAGSAALSSANRGGDAILAPITLNDNLNLVGGGGSALSIGGGLSGTVNVNASGNVNLISGAGVGATTNIVGTATFTTPPVLFSTSFYDSALYAYNGDTGATLATLVAPNNSSLLVLPAGLTIGPDGNLYLSSQQTNAILKYNVATDQLETFIDSSVLQPLAASQGATNYAPSGIRFDEFGNLYVAMNGGFSGFFGAVFRFGVNNTGGNLSYAGTNSVVASGLVQPTGITFGTASGDTGNLYVANSIMGNVVKVTGATGATPSLATFVANNSGGLQFPSSLAFEASSGKLYITDLGAFDGRGQVFRYDTDGSFDTVVADAGDGSQPGDLIGQFPSDLLFDLDGDLLVDNLGPNGPSTGSNQYVGSVYRYSSAGVFDTALVNFTQFPNTSGPNDPTATGVIPSQIALAAPVAVPKLTVNLPAQVTENAGVNALQGTVTRSGASLAANLIVNLVSSDTTELQVPATVTILAGQASATFNVTVPNDNDDDHTQNVKITARVAGLVSGIDTVAVLDDDAPVIAGVTPAAYTENEVPVRLAGSALVTDNNSVNFNTGSLTVSIVANASADDRLTIKTQALISVTGNTISYNGNPIGTFVGGTGTTPLVVTFDTTAATPDAARALVRSIHFSNVSDAPTTGQRVVRFRITDGDGGLGNIVNQTLTVTAANDAPAFDGSASPELNAINEHNTTSFGTNITKLVSGITDADSVALKGIAITSVNNANGSWEFTLDNGTTWTTIGPRSLATALLLPSNGNNTRIRFLPNADYNGTSVIWYTAWDQTDGAPGGTVDLQPATSRGGVAAYSSAQRSSTITVNAVNDAPVLDGISGSVGYTRGGAAVQVVPAATAQDIDSSDLDTGILLIRITSATDGTEQLTLGTNFSVDGSNNLFFGATNIGTRTGNGLNGNDLRFVFNNNATPNIVQAMLRSLRFATTATGSAAGPRVLGISLTDGDGGSSGVLNKTVNVI